MFVDGNGTIIDTTPLTVQAARPVGPGRYQGTNETTGAVESVVSATVPIEAGSHFAWEFGNQLLQRQAQEACDPGHPPLQGAIYWKAMLPGDLIAYKFSGALEWTTTRKAAVVAALTMWTAANITTKLNTRFQNNQAAANPPLEITVLPQVFDANLDPQSAIVWPQPIGSNGILTKAKIEIGLDDFNGGTIIDTMFTKLALHETGHLLGLDHNVYYILEHPHKFNGSSVMNFAGSTNDSLGYLPTVVPTCDAAQARAAAQRAWPPQ